MAKLACAYPRLTVEIHIHDAFVDIVARASMLAFGWARPCSRTW
ncbi:hypothetical protein [Neorhizobium sp. S3-V5DH]|nr:hypothetical protein [Neorhizobium sp. S3-V5DH]